jgi:hypothetical protein
MKKTFRSITSKPLKSTNEARASIEELEPETNIAKPSLDQVIEAKEWVESNEL